MIAPPAYTGAADPAGSPEVRVPEGHAGWPSPGIVLIIDPDPDSRCIYATLLRHLGYRVAEARNGVHGILAAREQQPDLIVTELFVPSGRGWKVPELLKRDPRTAEIPIVALTAHALPGDEERALSAGCDRYLAKPCEPLRLLQEIRRMLRPVRGQADASEA